MNINSGIALHKAYWGLMRFIQPIRNSWDKHNAPKVDEMRKNKLR